MTEDEFLPVPKVNRFYPGPKSIKAQLALAARFAALVPNRADRRRKHNEITAVRVA